MWCFQKLIGRTDIPYLVKSKFWEILSILFLSLSLSLSLSLFLSLSAKEFNNQKPYCTTTQYKLDLSFLSLSLSQTHTYTPVQTHPLTIITTKFSLMLLFYWMLYMCVFCRLAHCKILNTHTHKHTHTHIHTHTHTHTHTHSLFLSLSYTHAVFLVDNMGQTTIQAEIWDG